MIAGLTRWLRKSLSIPWGGGGSSILLTGSSAETTAQKAPFYYSNQSTVALAISLIAEDAASIPWKAYREGTDEELPDAPVIQFWRDPTQSMTGFQFWVGTYVSYLVFGEFFWWYPDLRFNAGRVPTALRTTGDIALLDPRRVRDHRIQDDLIQWNWHRRWGGVTPLDDAQLTRGYRYNPDYNSVRGLPKLQSVILEASGEYAATAWNERFFNGQNGIPTGVLTPGEGVPMTEEARRDLRRTWNERHGNSRSLAILPGHGWTFDQLGLSQTDMGFVSLKNVAREVILGAFGVPPFIAGVLENANYANARSQKDVYWNGTITRFLRDIASVLNDDFLPKVGVAGIEVRPDWSEVAAMTEDLEEKSQTAERLFKLGFTRNMLNDRLALGFDLSEDPNADVSYLPIGFVDSNEMAGSGTETPSALEPPADPETGQEEPEPAMRGLGGSETRREMVWRQVLLGTEAIEAAFEKTMRRYFKDLEQIVMDALPSPSRAAVAELSTAKVLKIREDLLVREEADRILVTRTRPLHKRGVAQGGTSLLLSIGADIAFDVTDPRVIAQLAVLGQNITGINARLIDRIRQIFADVFDPEDPGTLEILRSEIAHEFDVSRGRSATIARTETAFAWNGGRFEGMKQAGIQFQEWLSSRDPDVRDTHRPRTGVDGEIRAIGSTFSNGLRYPGDPNGPASEVINCRCVAVPVEGPRT